MTDDTKTKALVYTGEEPRTFQKYGPMNPGDAVEADPGDVKSLILTGYFKPAITASRENRNGKE